MQTLPSVNWFLRRISDVFALSARITIKGFRNLSPKILCFPEFSKTSCARPKFFRSLHFPDYLLLLLLINLLRLAGYSQSVDSDRAPLPHLHRPWIWEATHPSSGKLFLVGVVHVSDESERTVHSLYDGVLREVVQIRFETLPGQWDAPEAGRLLHQRGVISRSSPDFAAYSANTVVILKRFAKELGEQLPQFARYEPWLALIELEKVDAQRLGLTASHSLEHHLLRRAVNDRIPIGPLETLAAQIDAFDKLNRKDQEEALIERLNSIRGGSDDLRALRRAWFHGDMETMLEALELSQPATRSVLRQSIIDDRNARWLPTLLNDSNQNKTTLVVVGIEHIVTPETGLADILKERGFRITRYSPH